MEKNKGHPPRLVLVVAVLVLMCCGQAGAGYRMPITFGGYSNRTEVLTNFPVLVVFSNHVGGSDFRFADHPFLSSRGWDLRFRDTPQDPGAGSLPYEIEQWNPGGDCLIWVRVPRLHPNGTTTLWATWGDAGDGGQLPCTTNGTAWDDDFRGVWHMRDASALHVPDSTAGRCTGRKRLISKPEQTAGATGYGQRFDGTDGSIATLVPSTAWTPFTISLLALRKDDTGSVLWGGYNAAVGGQRLYLRVEATDELRLGVGAGTLVTSNSPFQRNRFQHIAATWDGTSARIVVDGVQKAAVTAGVSGAFFNWPLPFGGFFSTSNEVPDSSGPNRTFTGIQDECRISSVMRGDDWLWAESRTALSNGFFTTYGNVSRPATPLVENVAGATGVTAKAAWLTGRLVWTGASETVWGVVWGLDHSGATLDGWSGGGQAILGMARSENVATSVFVSGLAAEQPQYYAYWASNAAGLHVGKPAVFYPTALRVAVETEDVVFSNRYSNNGSSPMWCFNNTCVVRMDTQVWVSAYEHVAGYGPPNDCRWGLYRRGTDGWHREQGDTAYRTREPTPILCFAPEAGASAARLFLSANPWTGSAAQPQLLEFDPNQPAQAPTVSLPGWSGSPSFSDNSYRSTAADAACGELILFQNVGEDYAAWALLQSNGVWRGGALVWPLYAPTDLAPFGATRARVNYPVVALQRRAVHFCGVAAYDNWDRVLTEADLDVGPGTSGLAGRVRGNRFRRLLYTWTEQVGDAPFHGWVEIDNTFRDGGWVFAGDIHLDATGTVHLVWFRSPMLPGLRDELYPDIPRVYSIEYAALRNGVIHNRRTLVRAGEGFDATIPNDGDQVGRPYVTYTGDRVLGDSIGTARFHVLPDGRLFVVYYVGGTREDGTAISENRILEVRADGRISGPVTIPLAYPLIQHFQAAPHKGCAPSLTLDMLGHRRGGWAPVLGTDYAQWDGTISYARVRLFPPVAGEDAFGIPDEWKSAYFGGTNSPDSGAADDWDRDSFNNYSEWRAGTDPTNAMSNLRVTNLRPLAGDDWELVWTSVSGKWYGIDSTTNLTERTWRPLCSHIAAKPMMNTRTVRVDQAGQQFFRIRAE
jgi:hypothetical protein